MLSNPIKSSSRLTQSAFHPILGTNWHFIEVTDAGLYWEIGVPNAAASCPTPHSCSQLSPPLMSFSYHKMKQPATAAAPFQSSPCASLIDLEQPGDRQPIPCLCSAVTFLPFNGGITYQVVSSQYPAAIPPPQWEAGQRQKARV
ncbi:hypothetical protein KIL84_000001 [Mauremys mutica]|uniref:Uncharacterized protein n=1 Tax=Mauremys mutica TaxID=74926 RepID=A0A9D3WNE1_9SAUR|nr:hypothetical protein KIL84_000001 [Mauremys mutica]